LNFILNSFFLSYFGLFELAFFLLWVILNWLFLVSRQQSVGAASLAVIFTQFYAGKLDCCFIMIWLLALDAGAVYCHPLPMPSLLSSARSRRLPCSGGRTGGDGFGDDGVALFDVVDVSGRIAFVIDAPHRHAGVNVVIGGLLT